jgi:hypothetical protein
MALSDVVRARSREIASAARSVRIDLEALEALAPGQPPQLDEQRHYLEGPQADVAAYLLVLDAVNFGSGWFGELGTGTDELTARLTAHARAEGPWTAAQLRALTAAEVGATLRLDPAHVLTRLYAQGLNQLGAWLGDAPPPLGDSAERMAERLTSMPFFADAGFYKRAQIAAHDLHLAGVARYPDVARLTIFADNLVPHVLRHCGVLVYDDALARLVDEGVRLRQGGAHETEIRACAVHACEALARAHGVPPATLDNRLWNLGAPGRPHVTRTVYY